MEKFKTDELTTDIMRKIQILKSNRQEYKGQWTDEEFAESVDNFFQFCAQFSLEPSRPLLEIWLNVSNRQMYRWLGDANFGVKRQILEMALKHMEALYFAKLDSKPLPQMFKLKSKFNYVETQKVEVQAEAKVSADEIADKIAQLAID